MQWVSFAALRLAVGFLGMLPEAAIRRLGRWGGLVWYAVDPARRRIARRHMQRLGQPASSARRVFMSYGRYWAESFWVRPRRFSSLWSSMTVDGIENLEKAMAAGKGMIVVLPHLGNWEIAALIGLHLDLTVVAVAERLANQRITEWFTHQRSMFGIEIILTGQGRLGPKLVRAVKDGKAVCLLSDRDISGRGVGVEFFGEETTLPLGPVSIARNAGAPIIPVAIYFKDGPGHHAVIHPPLEFPEGATPTESVQVIAAKLEEMILRDPGQWHLVQPNWPSDKA